MYLCYEFAHWSAQKVGERFDYDPTYVLHAVSAVKARMEADKEFARIVVGLADGFEEISRPLNTSANGESASPMQQGRYDTTLPIGDILDDVFRATSSVARCLGTHGLRAGLEAIDELFGDLPYGETISVVGCDDAVAAVLHTVARNAALKGASVLYCTRGSARREALAIASALSHVPLDCLQDGSYNKGEARAFDFAIQEIKKWDIRFVEYDDSSDDFLTDLYRSIAQEFNLGETFKGTPRLIVVDSLLDKKTEGWKSAPIAEAAYLFDRITAQWRATLMFGLVGSHLKGGILGSSIPDLVYSMIELREFGEGERLIRPRITVAGGGCAPSDTLLALFSEFSSVDDLPAAAPDDEGWVGGAGVGCSASGECKRTPCSEPLFVTDRLLRHEIMRTVVPFSGCGEEASIAARQEQWDELRNWVLNEQADVPLEPRDFEAFIAYEVGFDREADSSYQSKGLCRLLHNRVMARVSCAEELEAQLLLALVGAFVFLDERIGCSAEEHPAYCICS